MALGAGMRRTSAIVVFALGAASAACADVKDYDWTLHDNALGGGVLTPFTMNVTGGNSGQAGFTEYRAVACVSGRVALAGTYESSDTGAFDYVYFKVNGVQTIIVTNANEGPFSAEFAVAAGQTFALGVATTDGIGGAGQATFAPIVPVAELDFSSFLSWSFTQTPAGLGAAGVLPPQVMKVTGGNSNIPGRAHVYAQTQMDMVVTADGVYTSIDEGEFDRGYVYTQAPGAPPVFTPFISNSTQGPFSKQFDVTGQQRFGLGVETVDGEFGPGILKAHSLQARATAGHIPNFGWVLEDTALGGGGIVGEDMVIVGGDSEVAGYTEYHVEALLDFCVQADMDYFSEDVEDFDACYYVVGGTTALVATNATQGVKHVQFKVERGDVFGFGVATADGSFGPGELIVTRFRAFPEQPCYPDCNEDGLRNIADFGCFQTRFALAQAYADCTADGVFSVADFGCFQTKFVLGCP